MIEQLSPSPEITYLHSFPPSMISIHVPCGPETANLQLTYPNHSSSKPAFSSSSATSQEHRPATWHRGENVLFSLCCSERIMKTVLQGLTACVMRLQYVHGLDIPNFYFTGFSVAILLSKQIVGPSQLILSSSTFNTFPKWSFLLT